MLVTFYFAEPKRKTCEYEKVKHMNQKNVQPKTGNVKHMNPKIKCRYGYISAMFFRATLKSTLRQSALKHHCEA